MGNADTRLSRIFAAVLQEAIPEEAGAVALLNSGGVDSLSVGFAARRLGLTVHSYAFEVEGFPSADSAAAAAASEKMGWDHTLVRVPTDNLEDDFLDLARLWGCRKKTQFECTWPFLYLVPQVTETFVLSGYAADGYFGVSKKAMMHWRTPKERFDEFRRAYFAAPPGYAQLVRVLTAHGKVSVAPYVHPQVFDYFMAFDWDALNKPYQKMHTLRAFEEEFQVVGRRLHANLQLVSGVDRVFERLLSSPLNAKGRTRVMDLCRDYASEGIA